MFLIILYASREKSAKKKFTSNWIQKSDVSFTHSVCVCARLYVCASDFTTFSFFGSAAVRTPHLEFAALFLVIFLWIFRYVSILNRNHIKPGDQKSQNEWSEENCEWDIGSVSVRQS